MVNGFHPKSLKEALELRSKFSPTPYAGGTDLMIKDQENETFLFIHSIPELRNIVVEPDLIRIGSALTFRELIETSEVPELLKEALRQIAAPAIRNLGTMGGNICNASPKADSALILYAMDAKLRLCSLENERIVPIEDFYLGRNQSIIGENELLVEILVPRKTYKSYYYKKVGARKALAISRLSFVGIWNEEDGRISECTIVFGAIGDTILRFRTLEALLIGKSIKEAKDLKNEFIAAYDKVIQPIRGRVSSEYRKHVCMNLLNDFIGQFIL